MIDKGKPKKIGNRKWKIIGLIVAVLVLIWFSVVVYNYFKPLPEGVNFVGEEHFVGEGEIEFLYDLSYSVDEDRVLNRNLFGKIIEIVDEAEEFVLIDMFLFDVLDPEGGEVAGLVDKLVEKKRENPEMIIYFITDEINTNYGSENPYWIEKLEKAGVVVVFSDMSSMRDANAFYTGFWRTYIQLFGLEGKGWISYRGEREITIRSFLKSLTAKFNHRKVIIGDDSVILSSGNLRELDKPYSDTGVLVKGDIWRDVFESEKIVAGLSGVDLEDPRIDSDSGGGDISVRLLTESKIGDWLLEDIDSTLEGDRIEMVMFLLSDDRVIESLIRASERGAEVRLVLDPSKSLFGVSKYGSPNLDVARDLVLRSDGLIKIRIYETEGEQFHSKMIVIQKGDGWIAYIGSANLNDRSIGRETHFESEFRISGFGRGKFFADVGEYFERVWGNEGGEFTSSFLQ